VHTASPPTTELELEIGEPPLRRGLEAGGQVAFVALPIMEVIPLAGPPLKAAVGSLLEILAILNVNLLSILYFPLTDHENSKNIRTKKMRSTCLRDWTESSVT